MVVRSQRNLMMAAGLGAECFSLSPQPSCVFLLAVGYLLLAPVCVALPRFRTCRCCDLEMMWESDRTPNTAHEGILEAQEMISQSSARMRDRSECCRPRSPWSLIIYRQGTTDGFRRIEGQFGVRWQRYPAELVDSCDESIHQTQGWLC